MSELGIVVTICRNLKTDDEDPAFDTEVSDVLQSLGRDWTVTDYEFIDKDGWRPIRREDV